MIKDINCNYIQITKSFFDPFEPFLFSMKLYLSYYHYCFLGNEILTIVNQKNSEQFFI